MKKSVFSLLVLALTAVVAFSSCSKDDGEDALKVTSSTTLTMQRDKTSQITCNKKEVTYASEDEFVAVVSESGLITAKRIGETYITLNGKKMVKVTVEAVYNNFQEPVKLFNVAPSVIKSKEVGSPKSETSTALLYNGVKNETARAYVIKNGGISSSMMVVRSIYSSTLANFLLERYCTLDINTTSYKTSGYMTLHGDGFPPNDISMVVAVLLESVNYFSLVYMAVDASDFTTYSKVNESAKLLDKVVKEMEKPSYVVVKNSVE